MLKPAEERPGKIKPELQHVTLFRPMAITIHGSMDNYSLIISPLITRYNLVVLAVDLLQIVRNTI